MKYLALVILGLVFSSCLKEEIPVPKKEHGNVKKVSVTMESDYKYQLFFNLSESKVVSKNNRKIWDIGFETGANGHHIITNSSKYMFVYTTDKTELSEVMSKNGYTNNLKFDNPTGDLDLTAIGNWQDGFVRILDMGISADGVKQGWYKIKITNVTATSYDFEFAKIDEVNSTAKTVQKKNNYSFTYFSLIDNKELEIAPPKKEWDLVFTQYTTHLTQPIDMDYLVTGCLTNSYNTKSAEITEVKFDDIDFNYASSLLLSENINTIGYGWKDVGLENVMEGGTADYTIYENKSYVIQTQNGKLFKLRFISFYSDAGEKGTPTFEFIELD